MSPNSIHSDPKHLIKSCTSTCAMHGSLVSGKRLQTLIELESFKRQYKPNPPYQNFRSNLGLFQLEKLDLTSCEWRSKCEYTSTSKI